MEKLESPDGQMTFIVSSDLERYRVETLFNKEPETIAWIDSWSGESPNVFFDVGANIGIYSVYAATQSSFLDVYSFEPETKNFGALVANIAANDLRHVFPFCLALSNQTTLTLLRVDDPREGNSNSQIVQTPNQDDLNYDNVRHDRIISCTLDFLIESLSFPIPNYVKIDVDGQESSILAGMTEILRDERLRSILIEFNSDEDERLWTAELKRLGLLVDHRFDDVPGHSSLRRRQKGSSALNIIYSRS